MNELCVTTDAENIIETISTYYTEDQVVEFVSLLLEDVASPSVTKRVRKALKELYNNQK